jgi:hypothetical protein
MGGRSMVLLALAAKAFKTCWASCSHIAWTGALPSTLRRQQRLIQPKWKAAKRKPYIHAGGNPIFSTIEYNCYLGVTFTLSGASKPTESKLRQKGLRGYFSHKRMIDIRHIRKSFLFKFFDALLRPIVSYACQIWLPSTLLFKTFTQAGENRERTKAIPQIHWKISTSHSWNGPWALTTNKTTLNAAVWGDWGRYPLAL